jgi:hypothetical protein
MTAMVVLGLHISKWKAAQHSTKTTNAEPRNQFQEFEVSLVRAGFESKVPVKFGELLDIARRMQIMLGGLFLWPMCINSPISQMVS